MKILLTAFLLPVLAHSQDYTLEDIRDDNLYNHFTPIFTYPNSDNLVVNRDSSSLGMFLFYDSLNNIRLMERFHRNGQVSLIIRNLSFNIRVTDSTFNYCTTGNVNTYYSDGKQRSSYTLDSLGEIEGSIQFYSRKYEKPILIRMVNGKIYDGVYIDRWIRGCFVERIKKGNSKGKFYYVNSNWFLINSDGSIGKDVRETLTLRKIRKNYFLDEEYVFSYPSYTKR